MAFILGSSRPAAAAGPVRAVVPAAHRFLRDFVVEHSGERRGQLDIKHGGLIPIVDLARWAGVDAGVASASTVERLRAAEAAGTLDKTQARTLMEAFGHIFSLRLDHQLEQVRQGNRPTTSSAPRR